MKFGHAVPDRCSRTDRQTDRQTDGDILITVLSPLYTGGKANISSVAFGF